jgi:hypothetical protein
MLFVAYRVLETAYVKLVDVNTLVQYTHSKLQITTGGYFKSGKNTGVGTIFIHINYTIFTSAKNTQKLESDIMCGPSNHG